jgi:ribosome-associated protein
MADLQVNDRLSIPEICLHYSSSRSSGPGGQNVNKLNTRITLVFDLTECPTLTDDQKHRLLKKLAPYADKKVAFRLFPKTRPSTPIDLTPVNALPHSSLWQ